ncbi:MAG: TrmH family RNA methyltransferase [Candidatus Saccharimonadales bacterium]
MREIYVIAHNMRSTFNVGSLLRTAEGLGVKQVYLTGYTPYPIKHGDKRLPHEAAKLNQQIRKTALGAEITQAWRQYDDIQEVIKLLQAGGIELLALEQSDTAVALPAYKAPAKVALLLGEEINGVPASLLKQAGAHICIPMSGKKESFNVVIAAAMALYQLRFT